MKAEELIQAIRAAAKDVINEVENEPKLENKSHGDSEGHRSTLRRTTCFQENDLMEIVKTRVTYDDVMHWIKEHIKSEYNGVYIHRSKARFFDKGDYSLKIFYAVDKEPQTGDNDPAIVFTCEQLDDALNDMLSDRDTILIKLNKQ